MIQLHGRAFSDGKLQILRDFIYGMGSLIDPTCYRHRERLLFDDRFAEVVGADAQHDAMEEKIYKNNAFSFC